MALTEALAIDCEMVGVGPRGSRDQLARVSIVNEYHKCIYDKFVYPVYEVTDYRTQISGIRKQDLVNGQHFDTVREDVRSMIKGRWLVGHGLDHDLRALRLSHPGFRTRDTSEYPPFVQMNRNRKPSLRYLARRILGWTIQNGQHNSVEDAEAAMRIYKTVEKEWEDMSDSESEDYDDEGSDYSDSSDDY